MDYQSKHSTVWMAVCHPGYGERTMQPDYEDETEWNEQDYDEHHSYDEDSYVPSRLDRQQHREQGDWYEDEKGE